MADKYVRHDAAGAGDGSTTAASGATGAFTFAQMLADTTAPAGTRYIVMATGTYLRSATGTFAHANGTAASNIVVTGGNASGVVDGTRPTIQASAGTLTLFGVTGGHVRVDSLILDGNAQTATNGLSLAASYTRARLVKAANCTSRGVELADSLNQVYAERCEATGGSGIGFYVGTSARAAFCEAYGNANHGFQFNGNGQAFGCVASANSGASSDGFNNNSVGYLCFHCTSYNNGRAGFDLTGNAGFGTLLANCVAYGNANEGFATDGVKSGAFLLNCGGGSNTSGNYNATNLANVSGFVALTGNPFTSAGTGDFSLNATAGAGGALRAAGYPGLLPRGISTGYTDIGAVQHQDAGGGSSGMLYVPNLEGV